MHLKILLKHVPEVPKYSSRYKTCKKKITFIVSATSFKREGPIKSDKIQNKRFSHDFCNMVQNAENYTKPTLKKN